MENYMHKGNTSIVQIEMLLYIKIQTKYFYRFTKQLIVIKMLTFIKML